MNKKRIMRLVAGVVFLCLLGHMVPMMLRLIRNNAWLIMNRILLVIFLLQSLSLLVLSILCFIKKPLRKTALIFILLYGLPKIFELFYFKYTFKINIFLLATFMVAVFLSFGVYGWKKTLAMDTTSEAAKKQIQAEKQTSVYEQQLREGILTQEEYDQLTKK